MPDEQDALPESQREALLGSIAALEAAGVDEAAIAPLRQQLAALDAEAGQAAGVVVRDVSTQGGDFTGRDKTVEARERGTAIGGSVTDSTLINADVLVVSEKYWRQLRGSLPSQDLQRATEAYFRSLLTRHRFLSLKGMGVSDRVPLQLPLLDLYIPLKARRELPEGETWKRNLRLAGRELAAEDAEHTLRLSEPQPVLDLLRDNTGLIVLGDPGSGKTTFLKYLALQLALGEGQTLGLGQRLPILVSLSAYASALEAGEKRLDDFVVEQFEIAGADLPVMEMLSEALSNGGMLILLDGLDEVKEPGLRHTVVSRVESFYSFHQDKGNKFVLTSRIVGYREARPTASGLVECTLVDFSETEIIAFVEHWTSALERQAQGDTELARLDAEREKGELLDSIRQNPGVRQLAANPLLLTILALMKRQGVTLPERRVELYDQYVRTLLSTWNRARGLSGRSPAHELDVVRTVRMLAPVALWMHETEPGIGLVRREDLRRKLEQLYSERGDPNPESAALRFLADVREHAGLLLERGPGEYGFIHLTFEEYLAAVAVALQGQGKASPIADFLGRHVGEQPWREVSLLAVGYLGIIQQLDAVAGDVVETLVEEQPGSPGQAVVLAGEAVLDAQPEGVPQASKTRVVQALSEAMQADSVEPALRRQSGLILGRLGWWPQDLDAFVRVPAGRFLSGDEREEREIPYDFWIGRYPVTNLQYARFMADNGYDREALWSEPGWAWRNGADPDLSFVSDRTLRGIYERQLQNRPLDLRDRPYFWRDSDWNNPVFPVVGVTWFEAQAYCSWLRTQELPFSIPDEYTVRLPTEVEWERAARGTDGREYPWGDNFEKPRGNTEESGDIRPTAVCTYPQGISPEKVWDMSGNVWEWTASWYQKADEYRVVRGGSWLRNLVNARCAFRRRFIPDLFDLTIGFRVVVSLAGSES